MRRSFVMAVLVSVVGLLALTACAGPAGEPGATGVPGLPGEQGAQGEQGIAGAAGETGEAGHASHLSPDLYSITMEPFGHWHVGASKKLLFTVTDTNTGEPASVKDLVVQITRSGSTRVTERSVDAGQVVFEGDGIYSLEYTPSDYEPYSFSARFADGGQVFASSPWVAEIAKGGEEGIRRDIGGTSYVYQIRYHWEPGHAHASDTDMPKQVFEIMRGIQEGADINWAQPWRNTFDHVINAEHPEVIIESEDGLVSEELHPVYKGKGIYESERIFSSMEVGEGADYDVTFSFTDPYNGAEVSNAEHFHLHISAPH